MMDWLLEISPYGFYPIAFGILVCLFYGIIALRIRGRKRNMEDYGTFVRETYLDRGAQVPELILRYFRKDVEAYNTARSMWPFRHFWPEVPLEHYIDHKPNR